MNKIIYEISKSITPEMMKVKRDQVTISELRTAKYLRELDNIQPDPLDQFRRYKG
jgi:hypothetical protein